MTEIKREEPDGIGPEITAALSFSETEWEQWLRECFPNFKGNYQRAAVLLRSFVQGMKYVSDRLTKRGLKKAHPPYFVILQKDIFGSSDVGYCHTVHAAYVKISFLELCSEYELNEHKEVNNDKGEFLYEGTLKYFFTAFGVEETHHAIYRRYKGERKSFPPPDLSLPLPNYDATDVEFKALKWQLRHAKEHQLPAAVHAFTKRIDAARKVREQQQETCTLVQSLQEEIQ